MCFGALEGEDDIVAGEVVVFVVFVVVVVVVVVVGVVMVAGAEGAAWATAASRLNDKFLFTIERRWTLTSSSESSPHSSSPLSLNTA